MFKFIGINGPQLRMGPAAIAIGGAAVAGGLAGAIKGAQGTPDQVMKNESTSQTTFAPASAEEQRLRGIQGQQFDRALEIQGQLEQGLGRLDPLQQQATQGFQDIIGGQALQASPEEMRLIEAQRRAAIGAGEMDINRFAQEGLQGVLRSAGGRGLRGQALGALQGEVLNEAQQQQARLVSGAGIESLRQQADRPFQRVGAQQPFLQQGFTGADVLRQQALANRQALQNPLGLQQLREERLAGGSTTTTGSQTQVGQKGSAAQALVGGLTGGLQGAQVAGNVMGGMG